MSDIFLFYSLLTGLRTQEIITPVIETSTFDLIINSFTKELVMQRHSTYCDTLINYKQKTSEVSLKHFLELTKAKKATDLLGAKQFTKA